MASYRVSRVEFQLEKKALFLLTIVLSKTSVRMRTIDIEIKLTKLHIGLITFYRLGTTDITTLVVFSVKSNNRGYLHT